MGGKSSKSKNETMSKQAGFSPVVTSTPQFSSPSSPPPPHVQQPSTAIKDKYQTLEGMHLITTYN